jgi:hypothetical protein
VFFSGQVLALHLRPHLWPVRHTLAVDFAYASAGKSLIDKLSCLDGAGFIRARALVAWLGKRLVEVSAPVCYRAPEVAGKKLL